MRGIEDELEESLIVAEHLGFGQFGIAGDARFVRNLVAGQLFLGGADHGNLGNGVDAIGNQVCGDVGGGAEDVRTGESSLLHRGAGQSRKSDDIAGGVNVRDGGLIILIHDELAPAVGYQPDAIQIELIAVGLTADRVK